MTINFLPFAKVMSMFWRVNVTPCIYTIGYEGLTIQSFIDRLLTEDVQILIDVRNNPLSRKPGFSKTSLRDQLQKVGVSYQHIPELGVPSALRKNLGTKSSYRSLFRYYDQRILAYNLDSIETIKAIAKRHSRVALMCFEADYNSCHRHMITEYLSRESTFRAKIVHLS